MGRRVLVIVLLVVLALLAYAGYSTYDAKRAGATGEVFSSDTRDQLKTRPASTATTDSQAATDNTETIVYPSATTQSGVTQAAPASATQSATGLSSPSTSSAGTLVTQGQQAAPPSAPASDTISPNPPNGMAFAGSGRYQLYRQGNITWRLDTETGRSCVIFATDEEWRKPRVYKAGCGRS
jgi:hypothetical protein